MDTRPRLDPLDPATFRHLGGCEQRDVTDPTFIKAILRVHDRDGYWWVECAACDSGWQVPFYAAGGGVRSRGGISPTISAVAVAYHLGGGCRCSS